MLKPAGEIIEQAPSAPGITGRVGLIHRPSHRGSQPLGQRLGDIALFMLAVALNQGVGANTSTTALCSALEPSITTNNERFAIQSALDQIGQQRTHGGRRSRSRPRAVPARAFCFVHAHRRQHHMLAEMHPVDQQLGQGKPA